MNEIGRWNEKFTDLLPLPLMLSLQVATRKAFYTSRFIRKYYPICVTISSFNLFLFVKIKFRTLALCTFIKMSAPLLPLKKRAKKRAKMNSVCGGCATSIEHNLIKRDTKKI